MALVRVALLAALLAPLWAQTSQAQSPQHFVYKCSIKDGVSVAADGSLVRNGDTQDYVQRQSPITFDTQTGTLQRAAGVAAGISETFTILNHGSMIEGLDAYDATIGLGSVLHIRVDMPGPPYRFVLQGSGSTFSGACERTPK